MQKTGCNKVATSDVPDPQFRVRPDPNFFFKLRSGRNRTWIFFSNLNPAGTGFLILQVICNVSSIKTTMYDNAILYN